jgi:protein transport protein SEC61 subunit gamma-like protein
MKLNIKERLEQYRRTIEVSRKPDREEFFSAMKITGAGIVLIGAIGLIIFLLYYLTIGGVTPA